MAKRLHMTNADYVAIAVSPALIMALVGSLVFFLIEVLYVGQYQARLSYAFGLFVFAAVLIGRISIEMGSERASLFALPLGIAMFLVLAKFVEHPSPFSHLINLALLGIVWWCAHKLTWDSTLIDDDQDASGEGLMQRIGVEGPAPDAGSTRASSAISNELLGQSSEAKSTEARWWERLIRAKAGPHTPGLWVLYFSLAALPLFGIGQHWIPAADVGRRRYAFALLLVYVAAALTLLVTTSFLGLRRYLRQRRIEMPGPIAATWVGLGTVLIALVMLAAAVIPRPAAEVAISQVPWQAGSAENLAASRRSIGNDATQQREDGTVAREESSINDDTAPMPAEENSRQGQGASPAAGERTADQPDDAADAKSDDLPDDSAGQSSGSESRSPSGTQGGQSSEGSQSTPQQSSRDSSASGSKSSKTSNDERTQRDNPPQTPPDEGESNAAQDEPGQNQSQPSEPPHGSRPTGQAQATEPLPTIQNLVNSLGGLAGLLKLLFYLVAAVFVLYLIWKSRRELGKAIVDILQQLRQLLASLFGGTRPKEAGAADDEAAAAQPRRRSFAEFRDPFASGEDGRMPPDELVRYTFAAFEAWAGDRGCPRSPNCTPHEFARAAVPLETPMSAEAQRMARLYSELAYASRAIPRQSAAELRDLWVLMRQPKPAPVETSAAQG